MKIELDKESLEKMWLEFDWAAAEYELLDLQKQLTKACKNDEFVFCRTEKSIDHASPLELINILEQIKNDEKKSNRKLLPAYAKLSKYFLAQNSASITMTFKQIESIIEKPLAKSAYDTNFN